jgi:hypothetical protein
MLCACSVCPHVLPPPHRYNGHYYRAMRERLPFAGALQRAALRTYSGISGHMAMPDSAEEQQVIAEVARAARYESIGSVWDRGQAWVPVVASGISGKSTPTFQSLGRVCVARSIMFSCTQLVTDLKLGMGSNGVQMGLEWNLCAQLRRFGCVGTVTAQPATKQVRRPLAGVDYRSRATVCNSRLERFAARVRHSLRRRQVRLVQT